MAAYASTLLAWADARAADNRLRVREGDGLSLWPAGEGSVLRGAMNKHRRQLRFGAGRRARRALGRFSLKRGRRGEVFSFCRSG